MGVFSQAHLTSALMAFGMVAAYCLFVLAVPTRRCGCAPGRGRGGCRRCRGTGRRRRLGAAAVHRFVWSVLMRRLMAKRRETIAAQLKESDQHVPYL